MSTRPRVLLSCSAIVAVAFGCVPLAPRPIAGEPAPATPLVPGVYSGTAQCDLIITSPTGAQTIQEQNTAVSFEINERGVPIVLGEEVRVGRTVSIGELTGTYTRIQATPIGIVIHSELEGSVNSLTYSGTSIAEMSMTDAGNIDYDITVAYLNSAGFLYNTGCSIPLLP